MRTTVNLDDDLAELLKQRARQHGVSFGRMLNEAIRVGLAPSPRRYRMKPSNLGVRDGVDLTRSLSLAAEVEDAEVVRRLELDT